MLAVQYESFVNPFVIIVGGLAVAMLLTLFVVPSAYVVLNSIGATVTKFLTGPQPLPGPRGAAAAGD